MLEPDAGIETIAVHSGRQVDPHTGAIAPPIHLSTTFERDVDGAYSRGYSYARVNNPARTALETALAALEGGADALAFSSGSAAVMSLFQALSPGDHVIFPNDMYYAVAQMMRDIMIPWGLQVEFIDMDSADAVKHALTANTRAVWVETPSNPMLKLVDIGAVADVAHAAGAICVVDGTFTTPILQRPLALGADIVIHSMSKYLGGHSDVLGGALIAREQSDLVARIRKIQGGGGAVLSPFDSWLISRGITTLPVRIRAQTETAMAVAAFLSQHPAVEQVYYPGLPSQPDHELACRQMSGFGPMMSFTVRRGERAAVTAAARVKLITRATSLGAVETLIEHRASIEGQQTRTPGNLLRLSVGLETAADLIHDLAQALDHVQTAPVVSFMEVPKRKR